MGERKIFSTEQSLLRDETIEIKLNKAPCWVCLFYTQSERAENSSDLER